MFSSFCVLDFTSPTCGPSFVELSVLNRILSTPAPSIFRAVRTLRLHLRLHWPGVVASGFVAVCFYDSLLSLCLWLIAKFRSSSEKFTAYFKIPPSLSCLVLMYKMFTGIAQSVYQPVTGWTFRWSNLGGTEIFRTGTDRPWRPPVFLCNGYRVSFPEVKRQGRGVNHSPSSSSKVKERVELHLYTILWP